MTKRAFDPDHCTACGDFLPCGNSWLAAESPATVTPTCACLPCPGRGNDGHGLTHCAECCFGSGVIADEFCLTHGRAPNPTTGLRYDCPRCGTRHLTICCHVSRHNLCDQCVSERHATTTRTIPPGGSDA